MNPCNCPYLREFMNNKSFPSYPMSSGPSLSTIFFHLSLVVLCIGFFLFISTTASEAFEQTQKPLILLHFIRDESTPSLETKGIQDKGKKLSDDPDYDSDSDDEDYVPPSTKKINHTKNKTVVDDDDDDEEEEEKQK